MKKNLTTLFFMLIVTLAYAIEIPVGYSQGVIASSSDYIVNGKGSVSAVNASVQWPSSLSVCIASSPTAVTL